MGRKRWKRLASLGLSAAMAVTILPGTSALTAQAAANENVDTVSVNPYVHYQTMEGWGTSLCWFANIIGGWDEDFNGNGTPDREEIAELIFSPDYLNMNLVRYNIGGGENPNHDHQKRVEGMMPSWKPSADSELDTTADANQLWFLDQANTYRSDDIINEVFSNSPPYYMTNSGCATGNFTASQNNLKDDCYDDFAQYLADVTEYLDTHLSETYGTGIDYIDPINEPDTSYWGAGSTKQEGCHFSAGDSQSKIFRETQLALAAKGLNDVKLTGTDETSVADAIESFTSLDTDIQQMMSAISTHTYGSAGRETLSDLAASYDKDLWMSEVCYGSGPHNPDSMTNTNSNYFGQQIMNDLKLLQPTTWVDWQVVDSEYECLQTDSNWGLIHAVFESDGPVEDYHTKLVDANGEALDDVPEYGTWHITKQFYTLMQYSKYIKQGYTLIEINSDNMAAALSPDKKELVIVNCNNTNSASTEYLDMSVFSNISDVKAYQTSDSKNCEEISISGIKGDVLTANAPANSITTYVISGTDALVESDGYVTRTNSGVQVTEETAAAGADSDNKFAYTGSSWEQVSSDDAYKGETIATSEANAEAVYEFTGTRAVILGTLSASGGTLNVQVDEGEAFQVTAGENSTAAIQPLVDTGVLEEGKHTVKMTVGSGRFAIDCAELYYGVLPERAAAPVVTNVIAQDQAALITFNGVEDAADYTVRYGTSKDAAEWNPADVKQISGSPAVLNSLTNGTTYYFTIEANVAGQNPVATKVMSVVPQSADGNLYYFVNAGVDNVYDDTIYPLGMYQSNFEQAYGEDAVTGKSWGYEAGTTSDASPGSDMWESVRTDDTNEVGKGLSYSFDLPEGKYIVEIGAYDPWNNGGRMEDFVVQGITVADSIVPQTQTKVRCAAVVGSDGKLTVQAVRSEGNTGEYEDPLLSYISISRYADDEILSVEMPSAVTVDVNGIPNLPESVTVTQANGESQKDTVTWDLEGVKFDALYECVQVKGKTNTMQLDVAIDVYVGPEKLLYFIDAGQDRANGDSATYNTLSNVYALKNAKADQAFNETDGWGYADANAFGLYEQGSDKYLTGQYAYDGYDLVYKVSLDAGSYDLTVGLHEWWGGRSMRITAETGNANELAAEEVTISGSESVAKELQFTLEEAAVVTIRVAKTGNSAPVLSWLAIAERQTETAKQKLQSLYDECMAMDLSLYTAATRANLVSYLADVKIILDGDEQEDAVYDQVAAYLNQVKEALVPDENAPVSVKTAIGSVAAVQGQQPALPERVEVETYGGSTVEADVVWDAVNASKLDQAYRSFTVNGKIKDTNLAVQATVEVIPENVEYYIDCGTIENASAAYDAVKAAVPDLKNDSSDQAYETGKSWGITTGYDGVYKGDGVNKFSGGYYGKNTAGKENGYAYKVTLDKGIYNVAMQSHEWWSGPRAASLEADYSENGAEKNALLMDRLLVSSGSRNAFGNGTLVIKEDNTEVTLTVYAATNQGACITFLGVNKLSDYMAASIEVNAPDKLVYAYGEELDLTGMTVTATYTDGSTQDVPLENCIVSGYDKTKVGTQTVTVAFAEKTASFEVTVEAKVIGTVKNAKASASAYNRVNLTWSKAEGADGYEVYRAESKNGTYQLLGTATAASYTDSKVTTGKTYYYKVRGYSEGFYGEYSNIVSAKTTLSRVTGVKASAAAYNNIKLSWKKVTGATGYEVYRATSKNGSYKLIKKVSAASYSDKTVKTGRTYYYKVVAYRGSAKASASAVVSKKTALSTTKVTLAKNSSTSLKIKWKKVSGANGYQVQYSTKNTTGYKSAATIKKAGTTSYTKKGLSKGKTYYVRVRAYRKVDGKNVYAAWSAVKKLKLK